MYTHVRNSLSNARYSPRNVPVDDVFRAKNLLNKTGINLPRVCCIGKHFVLFMHEYKTFLTFVVVQNVFYCSKKH